MKKNILSLSLISLALFTVGCTDKNPTIPATTTPTTPVTPDPDVEKTTTATFNIALMGMAVKGTMANASISVQQIDVTTGVMTPISFRVASSVEAESYTVSAPAGTSDDALDEMIASQVLAASPSSSSTNENGQMSIYLQNNFSGAVVIDVTSSSSAGSSWMRCDSYTDCGVYDNIASTVLPNDGDLAIEFGEWYKEDLTLTTIKYIAASETPDTSRSYTANVTVFTEIVATILQNNLSADPMVPISQQAISDASVLTVMQLLGPNGLIENGSLLSDISTGVGFDLSNIGSDTSLNTGNTALAQLAASLQTVAAAGDNGSLAEIIMELATSVSDGTLNAVVEEAAASSGNTLLSKTYSANNSSKASALFDTIQTRVKKIAAIYVAIVTGDTAALVALGVDAGTITSITTSVEMTVASGAITQQELINSAIAIVALVEEIGCTGDECTIGDDLYADLAAKVTAELAMLDTNIASLADDIDTAETAIIASIALGTSVADVATAVAYNESVLAAYSMVFDSNDVNELGNKANTYANNASAWVDTATFLVGSNSEYQSLLDSAQDTYSLAYSEAMQVNGEAGLHIEAKALLTDAKAKLVEFDAVVPAAKSQAESSNAMALTKQSMATNAQTAATNSHDAAMALNAPQSVESAAAYVMATEQALSDKLTFIAMADAYLTYAGIAYDDATAYAGVAETPEDISASGILVDSSTAMKTEAEALIVSAGEGLSHITDMVADAKAKQVILDKLPMVKATTQSFADISVITTSGRDALGDVAEIMFDVLEEANKETGDVTDKESSIHTGWIYSFNETNMTIEASHESKGSFQGFAEISNNGSETTLLFTWSASLTESGENGATFVFSSSESTLTFEGVFTSLDDLENQEPVSGVSSSSLVIVDGNTDFTGTLMLSSNDLSTTENPDVFEGGFVMDGMSGDVSFNLAFEFNIMGEEESVDVALMIGDSGYMMKGSADNGDYIMGSVWLGEYNYGDFMEMTDGVVVTYIDDDEVEYLDLSFTIDE
jgi:hypothetical protein